RLPVAAPARAGGGGGARGAHEQLARQRADPARGRVARDHLARARARLGSRADRWHVCARRARGDRRDVRRRPDRLRAGAGSGHREQHVDELSRSRARRRRVRVRARRPAESPARLPSCRRRTHRLGRADADRVVTAGVAAGHPATAAAGVEILAEGGSAADAAVAAGLAACVAETVMTGLLGGGHAIYYDAAAGTARTLDCFCAVPGLGAAPREPELLHLEVPFGAELVDYAVGAASCAVPGVPAGLGELWRAHGRLPWERLFAPALRLARDGVLMPPEH